MPFSKCSSIPSAEAPLTLLSVPSPQAPCSFVAYQVAYVHQRCKSKFAFSTAAKKWLSHKCKISEAQSIPRQCQTSVPGCSSCPFPLPLPDKFTPTNSMKLTQEQRDVCHCRNRLKKKITRGGYDTLRKGISAVLGQCSSNFFFFPEKKKRNRILRTEWNYHYFLKASFADKAWMKDTGTHSLHHVTV